MFSLHLHMRYYVSEPKPSSPSFSAYLICLALQSIFEVFHRKTGYIHFCQFEIFAIEAAEI